MTGENRRRSRIEILNYIINFCTVKCFGDSFSLNDKDRSFHGSYLNRQDPPIGSLCMLQSAPTSKFYLGWLKEIRPSDNRFSTEYLLESIEDGDLCWWSNVGIFNLPLTLTDTFPNWKWTDKQWQFDDKWFNACYKRRHCYELRPRPAKFNEDGSVILMLRRVFSDEIIAEKKFDNWRKVLVKDFLEFYDSAYSIIKNN